MNILRCLGVPHSTTKDDIYRDYYIPKGGYLRMRLAFISVSWTIIRINRLCKHLVRRASPLIIHM